ncbi:MAG: hypothetical protein KDA88_23885 [Planctomycetaceae bacterium]|nr:hypothetical protein [Planctomycetaceae bacterium]MCB9950541.1 hypothetical protein [Planctomycetaceae bacterium]
MNINVQLLLILACALVPFSGCTERREALGGGAESKTQVTVLRVDGGGSEADGGGDTGAAKITTFGTFKGRVVVTGTAPKLGLIYAKGDASVQDAVCRASDIPNESVVVSDDGGLANVFIFLRRAPKNVDIPEPPAEAVVLDQLGCKFIPHAAVVRVGQPLLLKNSDGTTHNVKGNGLAFTINETLGPSTTKDSGATRGESKPAEIVCNFHNWMRGWVLPLDHPWGVVTAADGSFEIQGVPSGEMEFTFYHEGKQVTGNLKVNIPADGEAEQVIEIDASKLVP